MKCLYIFKKHQLFFIYTFSSMLSSALFAQNKGDAFKVIAFYTARHDLAHISFVHEANKWFPEIARQYHFSYDSTDNWDNLNTHFLSRYQVVIFLDARPDKPGQ
ncbi:MAG TPA: ThuA domain-containing protein, partial [Hanamia sp.]|nr:ThuA domain-containing protein [Hanamia sp.]